MRFSLTTGSKTTLRLGTVSFPDVSGHQGRTFPTPLLLQYTKLGAVPHLSWDLSDKYLKDDLSITDSVANGKSEISDGDDGYLNLSHAPIFCPLPSNVEYVNNNMKTMRIDFRGFCRIPSNRPVILGIHDPLIPIKHGFNNKAGIAIWSTGGRRQVNGDLFVDFAKTSKPDVSICLCDSDTPRDSSNKRLSLSVNRTLDFLDKVIQDEELSKIHILAPIEGGFCGKSREVSVRETVKKMEENPHFQIEGFVLEGFHPNGSDLTFDPNDSTTAEALKLTTSLLLSDKLRFMFGSFKPEVMVELITKFGVDILDSSYATELTEKGHALLIDSMESSNDDIKVTSSTLDLSDNKIYKEDMSIIRKNCECHTCVSGFTRSYICHLIDTKEMLASVLLNLHNVFTLFEMFRRIHQIVKKR